MPNVNGMQEEKGGSVFWRVLTLRAGPEAKEFMGGLYWMYGMMTGTVVVVGGVAWCVASTEERAKVAEGLVKLLLAMGWIFVAFAVLATSDAVDAVERREKAAARWRKRRERQTEEAEMYWREVDPRGRFDVCTRTIQTLKREERARKRKWAAVSPSPH